MNEQWAAEQVSKYLLQTLTSHCASDYRMCGKDSVHCEALDDRHIWVGPLLEFWLLTYQL